MKNHFLFFFLVICFTMNADAVFSQDSDHRFTEKGMKKNFRQLRRKAPNREERKKIRVYEENYFSLLEREKGLADSIELQKAKVERLLDEVEKDSIIRKRKIDNLHAENDSLKRVMRNYVIQIDSLNALNVILEAQLGNAGDYYFNLYDFIEPKIYYFYCEADPLVSQYWKLSADMNGYFLITDAYSPDFEQFECFKEQYDSIGAKVVEYVQFVGSDSIVSKIGSSDVYHWSPKESITYSVSYESDFYEDGYSKTREFWGLDSAEIMGNVIEVMQFQDKYDFYRGGEVNYSFMQQSSYAKGIGLVRYVRFDEIERKDANYVLKAIYSEREWNDLLKKED